MSDTSYGKGISIASGFDLGAKLPLDSRSIAYTIEERDAHVDNGRAYEGMLCYVIGDKTTYQYTGTEWKVFGFDIKDIVVPLENNLTSNATDRALAANQGRVLKELIDALEANTYSKEEIDEIKRLLDQEDIRIGQLLDELANRIPTRISQLANDSNFTTKDYVDKKFEQFENGAGSGGANVYIGEEPPEDTSMIWVDSSTPYTLEPNTYENRLKNNYVMMLNNSYGKIFTIESGLTSLQNAIDKITSPDNAQKVTDFNIKLNVMMDDCNLLKDKLTKSKTSIINNSLSSSLKAEAKKVRKEVKTFIYSLYDLKHQIMQVIDSERITIVIPEEPENPDKPPVTIVDNYLLTEDGFTLLTEDGLMLIVDKETTQQLIAPNILTELGLSILTEDGMLILADGMDEVTFTDAILTELGLNILTEDGKVLLVDGVENDNSTETLADAILTELGLTLLTENGKQILKG